METTETAALPSGKDSSSPAVPTNVYMAWKREDVIEERKQAQNTLDAILARIQPIVDDIAVMDSAIAHLAIAEMQQAGQKGDHIFLQDEDFVIEIDNQPIRSTPNAAILEKILDIESLANDPQRIKAIRREPVPEQIIPAHTELKIVGPSLAKLARQNIEVAKIVAAATTLTPRSQPSVKWVRKEKQAISECP